MKLVEENYNMSLRASLTILKFAGLWCPDGLSAVQRRLYHCYTIFIFMFILGIYIIIQVVEMFLVWGDVALMTGAAFLLFTNLAQLAKILNLVLRRRTVGRIVREAHQVLASAAGTEARIYAKRCDRETSLQQLLYFSLTTVTVMGWASSAETGQLPLRAWYPYDTSTSPAYELTYLHQVSALFVAAWLNVAKDTLVSGLIAQTRCRLQLLNLALRNLHEGMGVDEKSACLVSDVQEELAGSRLRGCVAAHQRALASARELQRCFSAPTFAQFAVSMVIICVTAFQLASQTDNLVRFVSMGTYLLNMIFQVFIYCYQGNELREESLSVGGGAYESLWYRSGPALRRALLQLMTRARQPVALSAGGFTALSLSSFMAIIKASYSFFTVLQQITEE